MAESADKVELLENIEEIIEGLAKDLKDLYTYRDLFFEDHPLEMATQKNDLVEEKKELLARKFEAIDVDRQVPFALRAQFLYMKGRCYNISAIYDARASHCLSKAVKLNPHLGSAWNELGECYWKNMNVKEAKNSFEGALKHERNRLSLRCLSIILRQESGGKTHKEAISLILKSVDIAKEAVAQNIKDGVSWAVLGNAYLCQFFTVSQDPATLKLCMSAYKQAWMDPVARGQPDLYYNKGIALKYEECYADALENFDYACRLDPPWQPPQLEKTKMINYLNSTNELVRTRGKLKTKRLNQLMQTMDKKMLGVYSPGTFHTFGERRDVLLEHCLLNALVEGANEGKVVLGRVVGSMHNESAVPFAFVITDDSLECICITVYNWADGRGVIIGDCIAIPEPVLRINKLDSPLAKYNFKSVRLNSPMLLLVNGKRISRNQYACTRVTSTYEIH